jgi:hypothetical protein
MDAKRKECGLPPRQLSGIAFSGVTSQTINDDPTYQSRRFEPSKAFDPDTLRRAEVALCNEVRNRPGGLPLTVGGMVAILPATKSVHPSAMQLWKNAVEAALCTHWGWTKKGPAPDSEEATPPPGWQNLQSAGRGYTMKAQLSMTPTTEPMSEKRLQQVLKEYGTNGGRAMLSIDPPRDLAAKIEALIRKRGQPLSAREIIDGLAAEGVACEDNDVNRTLTDATRLTLDSQPKKLFTHVYVMDQSKYTVDGVPSTEPASKNPIITGDSASMSIGGKTYRVKGVAEARQIGLRYVSALGG